VGRGGVGGVSSEGGFILLCSVRLNVNCVHSLRYAFNMYVISLVTHIYDIMRIYDGSLLNNSMRLLINLD
jgi:hypothetical protein